MLDPVRAEQLLGLPAEAIVAEAEAAGEDEEEVSAAGEPGRALVSEN